MKTDKLSRGRMAVYLLGCVAVIWLGLLLAPTMCGGLAGIVQEGGVALNEPFQIEWCENSLRTVLIFLLIYAFVICVYLANDRNYRKREEYGSAKWGSAAAVNRKYAYFSVDKIREIMAKKPTKLLTIYIYIYT